MLYRFVAWLLVPLAWWGRLRVDGLDRVPEAGPLLVVPNHDSQMDPVLIALALQSTARCACSAAPSCGETARSAGCSTE